MAEEDFALIGNLIYWSREKCYQHMQTLVSEGKLKYMDDPLLLYFNAIALLLQGENQESLRQFESLLNKQDVYLGSTIAMLHIHKSARVIEKEAVQMLDAKLKSERKEGNAKSYYYAGLLLMMLNRPDKAREYIDRSIKMNLCGLDKQIFAMKGWIDLSSMDQNISKKSLEYFDRSLGIEGAQHPDAILGKVKYLQQHKQQLHNNNNNDNNDNNTDHIKNKKGSVDDDILEYTNQLIVSYAQYLPGLIEKMRQYMIMKNWDQVLDNARRILDDHPHCLQAKELLVVHHLIIEGNYEEASNMIGDLMTSMNQWEPQNHQLFNYYGRLFSRLVSLSNSTQEILQQCMVMSERSINTCNNNNNNNNNLKNTYLCDLADVFLLMNQSKDAMKCYNSVEQLDETNVQLIIGRLKCYLMERQYQEFNNEMEFLEELKSTLGTPPTLLYLKAQYIYECDNQGGGSGGGGGGGSGGGGGGCSGGGGVDKILSLIRKCIDMHISSLDNNNNNTTNFLMQLDANFVLNVVKLLLKLAPNNPQSKGQPLHPCVQQCTMLIDMLYTFLPAHLHLNYVMAHVKYLAGDTTSALKHLNHCLKHEPTSSHYHILMAQIYLHENNFKMADQSLDVGLSHNFQVREHPTYHLIKGQILKKQSKYEEALKTMQAAMSLPGVNYTEAKASKPHHVTNDVTTTTTNSISASDRASIYMELVDLYRLMDRTSEATQMMDRAMNEFRGTSEETRLLLGHVDLCLAAGQLDEALTILRNISPQQPYYVQAKVKMAEIYLKHRKDTKLYISCYKDLYDKSPSIETSILLGDAYMEVQQPDRAIESYETAMKKNPKDPMLANKIGQALVKTHQYGRAIIYYEASLKQSGQHTLRYDLAKLLMLLNQDAKAEKILKVFIDKEGDTTDLATMIELSRCHMLTSQLMLLRGQHQDKVMHLNKAKDIQDRVLLRLKVDQQELMNGQQEFAAKICSSMADHYKLVRDYSNAINMCKQALIHQPQDAQISLELASLMMLADDYDGCIRTCNQLIQCNMQPLLATAMLAEVLMMSNRHEQAMQHINQLGSSFTLQDNHTTTDDYKVLIKVIKIMRRAGRLDECHAYLNPTNQSDERIHQPGYNFCKGLYHWYMHDVDDALKHLNRSRKDSEYGRRSIYLMVDICVNPDDDVIGGGVNKAQVHDKDRMEGDLVGMKTAERLLKEIRPFPGDITHHVMITLFIIMTHQHQQDLQLLEATLNNLLELCKSDQDNVMMLYGTSVAFLFLKQLPKAKSQLKRIARVAWNFEDADYLERSWLLLADIYIQKENYDLAKEILDRCILYNKSCSKAYEYLGYISELQQSFKPAVEHYKSAWIHAHKKNPAIGYKLAHCALKMKYYTEAIDVCHQVLSIYPKYPRIQNEILDKARSSIKIIG